MADPIFVEITNGKALDIVTLIITAFIGAAAVYAAFTANRVMKKTQRMEIESKKRSIFLRRWEFSNIVSTIRNKLENECMSDGGRNGVFDPGSRTISALSAFLSQVQDSLFLTVVEISLVASIMDIIRNWQSDSWSDLSSESLTNLRENITALDDCIFENWLPAELIEPIDEKKSKRTNKKTLS